MGVQFRCVHGRKQVPWKRRRNAKNKDTMRKKEFGNNWQHWSSWNWKKSWSQDDASYVTWSEHKPGD